MPIDMSEAIDTPKLVASDVKPIDEARHSAGIVRSFRKREKTQMYPKPPVTPENRPQPAKSVCVRIGCRTKCASSSTPSVRSTTKQPSLVDILCMQRKRKWTESSGLRRNGRCRSSSRMALRGPLQEAKARMLLAASGQTCGLARDRVGRGTSTERTCRPRCKFVQRRGGGLDGE